MRGAGVKDEVMEDDLGEEDGFVVYVDGEPHTAYPGDTAAAVLYAAGRRYWRRSRSGEARGLFCGMGVCFDCLVTVDGSPDVRACQAPARPGMKIVTGLAEGAG